jgi:hypothetical protein
MKRQNVDIWIFDTGVIDQQLIAERYSRTFFRPGNDNLIRKHRDRTGFLARESGPSLGSRRLQKFRQYPTEHRSRSSTSWAIFTEGTDFSRWRLNKLGFVMLWTQKPSKLRGISRKWPSRPLDILRHSSWLSVYSEHTLEFAMSFWLMCASRTSHPHLSCFVRVKARHNT